MQREDMRIFSRRKEEWLPDDIYARAETGLNVARIPKPRLITLFKLAIQYKSTLMVQ